MGWFDNYIENISQSNESYYREFAQEWVDDYFEDSTLVRIIKEEQYPFENKYEEYEVQVDTVAEVTVNISKVIGDFISFLFRDCSHKNYRGQKYLYNDETYLCYEKINPLSKIAKTKLIRCNNTISWLDKNGNVLTEKVFLGYEISSTNDAISKDGIVSNRRLIVYAQNNKLTKTIKVNQRFMFQNEQCYRVEEIDNYNTEEGLDQCTLMKFYLVYSPLLSSDNKELNVCNYYDTNYVLEINQDSIIQIKNFEGKLEANVKNNEKVLLDIPIVWSTDNKKVIEIDEEGRYKIIGDIDDTANIICSMADNPTISDSVFIQVTEERPTQKEIVVYPQISILNEHDTVDLICKVYIEGEEITETDIECTPLNVPQNNYTLEKIENGYRLTNNQFYKTPLLLKFNSADCEEVEMQIVLNGLL